MELQERHTELDEAGAIVEYLPAEQSMQSPDEVASSVVEYLPLAQPVHTADPELENVPFGHGEQVADFAPDLLPAGHAVHSEAPLPDEKLPPLQTLHTLPPDEEEKVPAAHRVQAEDAFSE